MEEVTETATPQAVEPEAASTPEAPTKKPRYTFDKFCSDHKFFFRSPPNRACRAQEEARWAYNDFIGKKNPPRRDVGDEHYRVWLKRIGAEQQATIHNLG